MTAPVPASVSAALARGRARLADEPRLAQAEAEAVLSLAPDHLEAGLILGAALRRSGEGARARAILLPLAAAHPSAWGLRYEAGAVLAMLGETQAAISALAAATALNPKSGLAWHALADQLMLAGDAAGAAAAYERGAGAALADPRLAAAAQALFAGRIAEAAQRLREGAGVHLTDPVAVKMAADAGLRLGLHEAVASCLAPLIERAPDFMPLRHAHAIALQRSHRYADALAQARRLSRQAPAAPFRALEAALLVEAGEYEAASQAYAELLRDQPAEPRLWLSQGHVLKTVGRQAEAVAAYRESLRLAPRSGEAYWSLANLKVVRFTDDDLAAMQALLDAADLADEDRVHLHFALGKALEDAGRFGESFRHYERGNALQRAGRPYSAAANRDYVRRSMAAFTREFFAARDGVGCAAPDPIFVVGLPRSGSTLVEQILASHPAVEGTAELPDVTDLAARLSARAAASGADYPGALREFDPAVFAELGAEYLARAGVRRKSGRPAFVDKFPSNFMHLGLIHLMLPNSRIIDARRDPMATCVSAYKQNFAEGQAYSNDLGDLGRYYVDYTALMAHFDRVLPGRVHRLQYEQLIADPEGELRRLLAYCGLPYEPSCLEFHRSSRPVRTASSEQVRRPLSRDGLEAWRGFEPWLGSLKAALTRGLDDAAAPLASEG